MGDHLVVPIECRASGSGPKLHGTILTEGRASTGARRELFAPGALVWPEAGIDIRLEHLGQVEARAIPTRGDNGEIQIEAPATPALFDKVNGGAKYMSVEFHSVEERTTAAGVREILRAVATGAIPTNNPEYDTTRAELRTAPPPTWWL